ncbi:MAG: hypothetical protein II124_04255 [Clostridia bacterium]|nr:hypothetical protein [Clostridia bacterium]
METGNGADKLITTILEEAREQAAAIEWHANEAVDAIRKKLEQDREAVREEFTAKAQDERELILETSATNARLQSRKELLAGKRGVMDRAYEEAYRSLCALGGQRRTALLARMLKAECEGGETVRPSEKDREAVEKLLPACGVAGLKLGETDPGVTDGFTVTGSNFYKDCSFEALLRDSRAGLDARVAGILFK